MASVAPTSMMFANVSGCAQTAVVRCKKDRTASSEKPASKRKTARAKPASRKAKSSVRGKNKPI